MANRTEESKPKNPEGEMVEIPHEYLIEGVKKAVSDIKVRMAKARKKYGGQYNWKNPYEEFGRRFGYDDHERIWQEYDRIWHKQSTQPSVIRSVAKVLGEMARYHAISRLHEEMKKK